MGASRGIASTEVIFINALLYKDSLFDDLSPIE
jgi:hypothetical protein